MPRGDEASTPDRHHPAPGTRSWGEGSKTVLLLHGFSGGPEDLRLLAEDLAKRGFHCVAPTLPGHGPGLPGLAKVQAEDWLGAGLAALDALTHAEGRAVPVIGFSAGGALAIQLAAQRPEQVERLVLMAPALGLHGSSELFRRLFRLPLLPLLVPTVSKGPPDLHHPKGAAAAPKRIPTKAAKLLHQLIQGAKASLQAVQAPALVLWGRHDAVVPLRAAERAAHGLGSGPAELIVLEGSAHQLALDEDRAQLFEAVAAFLQNPAKTQEEAPSARQARGGSP